MKSLSIDVPYITSPFAFDCGLAAIAMAAEYFQKCTDIEKIRSKRVNPKYNITSSIELAICANKIGLNVDFYSKQLKFVNHQNLAFYRLHSSMTSEKHQELLRQAKRLGIKFSVKNLDLKIRTRIFFFYSL